MRLHLTLVLLAAACAMSIAAAPRAGGTKASPTFQLALEGGGSPAEPAGSADDPDRPVSGWSHFVHWAGHFHPPLTAFPIAMILGAAAAEVMRLISGAAWLDGASRWCIILGGVSAAIAAPLGWAFALDHAGSWVLETHRWLGTAAGAGALVLVVLSEMSGRPGKGNWVVAFRIVLFLAVPLVVATGFFGGAMVYGVHAYNWSSPSSSAGAESP